MSRWRRLTRRDRHALPSTITTAWTARLSRSPPPTASCARRRSVRAAWEACTPRALCTLTLIPACPGLVPASRVNDLVSDSQPPVGQVPAITDEHDTRHAAGHVAAPDIGWGP